MPKLEAFPEAVRPMLETGNWKILVRPSRYYSERIPYAKLRETLERTQVRLRGWYFPHLSNKPDEIEYGTNYYGTWVVFTNYEYWRFYESAQLVQYHGVREMVDEMYRDKIVGVTKSNLSWLKPDWSQVKGYFDIINFLYTVTEVFEFASRLALTLQLDDSMEVSIALRNIKGYILSVSDWGRAWDHLYQCTESELRKTWTVASDELKLDSRPFSLAAVKWFFERFGWTDANMTALQDAQRAFLKKRL